MTPDRACEVVYVCCWLHNKAVDFGYGADPKFLNPADQPASPDLIFARRPDNYMIGDADDEPNEQLRGIRGKAARTQLIYDYFNKEKDRTKQ